MRMSRKETRRRPPKAGLPQKAQEDTKRPFLCRFVFFVAIRLRSKCGLSMSPLWKLAGRRWKPGFRVFRVFRGSSSHSASEVLINVQSIDRGSRGLARIRSPFLSVPIREIRGSRSSCLCESGWRFFKNGSVQGRDGFHPVQLIQAWAGVPRTRWNGSLPHRQTRRRKVGTSSTSSSSFLGLPMRTRTRWNGSLPSGSGSRSRCVRDSRWWLPMNPPSLRGTTSDEVLGRDRFHPVLDGVEAAPTCVTLFE
jgi:hypothetical protein